MRIGAVMIDKLAPPPEMSQQMSPETQETPPDSPSGSSATNTPGQSAIQVKLPTYLIDELSWVARCEQVEISQIIVDAVDQYLADHWIRNESQG